MRVYLGTAALQVGVGFVLGALLGYLVGVAVQRWRNVRELRRIQQQVADMQVALKATKWRARCTICGEEHGPQELPKHCHDLQTELRRRKL